MPFPKAIYPFLDKFFFVFHIALILFNVFGWIPRATRRWNFITLLLTAFSWVVLGIFYGWGYCFLTDWHWAIRERMGLPVDSNSYIHFLITSTTSINVDEVTIDTATVIVFVLALAASLTVNIRRRRKA